MRWNGVDIARLGWDGGGGGVELSWGGRKLIPSATWTRGVRPVALWRALRGDRVTIERREDKDFGVRKGGQSGQTEAGGRGESRTLR